MKLWTDRSTAAHPKTKWSRTGVLLLAAALSLPLLSGCHGQREQAAFTVPEEFDASRNYEITFWPKTTPTKPRQRFISRLFPIFRNCIPISP